VVREHGLDTVDTITAMLAGDVKVFVSMGGNFALATPDTEATFAALRNCELTARERVFRTASGSAEFPTASMPDVVPPPGRLTRSTVRSHD
jgi:anaerobic selenocysteine-containing dehydrogenase